MDGELTFEPGSLEFCNPSGTSRGVMTHKKYWLLKLRHENDIGVGECSIIEGLSPDYQSDEIYEDFLRLLCQKFNSLTLNVSDVLPELSSLFPELESKPSVKFGLETALRDYVLGCKGLIFQNSFSSGQVKIPINGLIWMGDIEFMQAQVKEKIQAGFKVLKFKIGAIEWSKEFDLISKVRAKYNPDQLTIRVDANGGFTPREIRSVLHQLKSLSVHSIEQPLAIDEMDELAALSKEAIIPMALDESLIPCFTPDSKAQILDAVAPQFIVLKPSLHGGIEGVRTWIELAEQRKIGWWLTSALESNIGLNAVAQLAGEYPLNCAQGLGTGALFKENFPSNLKVKEGFLEWAQ